MRWVIVVLIEKKVLLENKFKVRKFRVGFIFRECIIYVFFSLKLDGFIIGGGLEVRVNGFFLF